MELKLYLLIYFVISLHLLKDFSANGERTKDKMYEEIPAISACFRKLNATHQIGCTSKRGGSTGVVHVCDTKEGLDFLVKNTTAPPYIPLMPADLFTWENLEILIRSNKISGLLLFLRESTKPKYFSHENKCPNERSSLNGTCKASEPWNPYGTGILYQNIPFPVFYLENHTDVDKIRDCYKKFNNYSFESQNDRSLCSLQMISFMYATKDTPTCIRRSKNPMNLNQVKMCDPLGDQNVWASLFPLVEGAKPNWKPIRDSKYILIAARMDTVTLFEKTSGAISPLTGLVTLLSVAKLLKSMLPSYENYDKNVLFMIFNGETYDYIGSQRMVYDMENGLFPIDLPEDNSFFPIIKIKDILLFVELSQLSKSGNVVVHYLNNSAEITAFYTKLNQTKDVLQLQSVQSLPPASLHSFLKYNSSLPGVILSDHKSQYANHYYNSILDSVDNIGYQYYNVSSEDEVHVIPQDSIQGHLGKVATMVARSIYEEVTGKYFTGNESADLALIDELFHCYLENPSCRVNKAIWKGAKFGKDPFSLYIGVSENINYATKLAELTLGWMLGTDEGPSTINCTNRNKYNPYKLYNMSASIFDLNDTRCFNVVLNRTEALSPAFFIEDYDWSSGKYSSWTESRWEELSMRIFLKPSQAHENMTIAIGCMSLIFSFVVVYFIKSRSRILFTRPLPSEAPTDC